MHRSEKRFPVHWTLKIPKRYKRNAINAHLNRATRIASTFTEETPRTKRKFVNADDCPRFVISVIKQFNEILMVTPKVITLYRQISLISLNH